MKDVDLRAIIRRESLVAALLRAGVPLIGKDRQNIADMIDELAAERDAAFRRGWEAGRDAAAAVCDARATAVTAVFAPYDETRLGGIAQGGVATLETTAAAIRELTPPEARR